MKKEDGGMKATFTFKSCIECSHCSSNVFGTDGCWLVCYYDLQRPKVVADHVELGDARTYACGNFQRVQHETGADRLGDEPPGNEELWMTGCLP